MSQLTEEEWWRSLEPDFPHEDIPLHSPHERTALWAYLQTGVPATEAAIQIMVIKAEDWEVYKNICYNCGSTHEHNGNGGEFDKASQVAELLYQVAMAKHKTVPKILNLIDAIEALPQYD